MDSSEGARLDKSEPDSRWAEPFEEAALIL